jgi:hypothetical protein
MSERRWSAWALQQGKYRRQHLLDRDGQLLCKRPPSVLPASGDLFCARRLANDEAEAHEWDSNIEFVKTLDARASADIALGIITEQWRRELWDSWSEVMPSLQTARAVWTMRGAARDCPHEADRNGTPHGLGAVDR